MTDSKLSPTTAKLVLTVAAVAGTLGGWVVLAAREQPSSQAQATVSSDDELPVLVEVSVPGAAAEPAHAPRLRVVSQPPPRPITLTRSSR
ncbi:MAG: hypothetical protein IPM35_23460 [Myxococcales bacterium]|nr:hypothetical protein [Myxococcales bacterium]